VTSLKGHEISKTDGKGQGRRLAGRKFYRGFLDRGGEERKGVGCEDTWA